MIQPIRILLYGYIDTNVIDGSAFFLPAMANMITSIPNVEVDLLLSTPVKRLTVLNEVLDNPLVRIIDPFDNEFEGREALDFLAKPWITEWEAAELVAFQSSLDDYDITIIRSTNVAYDLSRISEHLASSLFLYVTGVVNPEAPPSDETLMKLRHLGNLGSKFIMQTSEMASYLVDNLLNGSISKDNVIPLYPMVPDIDSEFGDIFRKKDSYRNLVYTGKFVKEWNPSQIISGFNEVKSDYSALSLNVAGDQFRFDDENPTFVNEVKHLLTSSEGVTWHGGVDREKARALISAADVGIGWRHKDLDSSLELSTKLLEYGSLGKPCIINRTPMHERLFGTDYPLYANSMTEYTAVLEKLISEPCVVESAAKTAYQVALKFTYAEASKRLLPYIIDVIEINQNGESISDPNDLTVFSMLELSPDEMVSKAHERNLSVVVQVVGPYLYLTSAQKVLLDSQKSMGILDFYVDWRASRESLRRSNRNSILKRPTSCVDVDVESQKDDETTTAKIRNLESRIMALRSEVQQQTNHNSTLESKLKNSEKRLKSLRESRLGKIQVALWSRKRK